MRRLRDRFGKAQGFLGRLARDVRGNTMAIMAAAIIPMAGLVGGGIDISRMYIIKTRMQHACDAGALAGRKSMGGGTWGSDDNSSAEQFFDANIPSAVYGATGLTKSFSENAGKVTGTASATVPMTLMRVLGKRTDTISVTCDAEMRLPNTDVMFVLDTTGSMAQKAVSSDPDTKIESLRTAVKCFYEIVARLDTDATCTTGTPSGGTGTQVQIRFGFVPYATNVNVGRLLPTSYIADRWFYQSRVAKNNTTNTTTYPNTYDTVGSTGADSGTWSGWSNYGSAGWAGTCSQPANTRVGPTTTTVDTAVTTNPSGARVYETRTISGYVETEYQTVATLFGFACQVQTRTRTAGTYTTVIHTSPPVTTITETFQSWLYGRKEHNISGLKNGTSWNTAFTLPIGANGTAKLITWDGCIEERQTTRTTNFSPIPADAKDLNIDMVPVAGDVSTQWGPVLPDVIYTRNSTGSGSSQWTTDETPAIGTSADYRNNSSYQCPRESRLLQTWPTASDFDDYVDSLTPEGNTYHDIGLLWGARLMSPTGIFAADNDFTPGGGEIERHLIFMTDGEACTGRENYTAYGIAWFDRRQTPANTVPTDGCDTTGTLTEQVNLRTAAICNAVKNKNITLWVIWFGAANAGIEGRLESCATSGRFFTARNSATLQTTFQNIANQISQLRLTK